MLINFSNNPIVIFDENEKYEIENKDIEFQLPKKLKQIFEWNIPNKIFAINWPGSFTALRVCCLCLNTINLIHKKQIKILETSKINIYKYSYKKWLIPKTWFIFIWQKKNVRNYNFEEDFHQKFPLDKIKDFEKDYFSEINKNNLVSLEYKDKIITLSYKKKLIKIPENLFSVSKFIKPNYMMDVNIS